MSMPQGLLDAVTMPALTVVDIGGNSEDLP